MSDFQVPVIPSAPEAPALTQMQRVIYTFTSPSKTFKDIKRNTSWWLPFVLTLVFGYTFFGAVTAKITWPQVVDTNLKWQPKQAERIEQLPPDQRATNMKITIGITQGIWAAIPILGSLLGAAIMGGILLATMNFGFGGKATFWQAYAVVMFANLPGLLRYILGTIAIFAGMDPESFYINNFAGTNPGYYLPMDTPKALMALATALDVTTIWVLILASIGISIVAGTKRSSGYIAVFGWWIVLVLIGVGSAAIFS
jgi:hypothetical protein